MLRALATSRRFVSNVKFVASGVNGTVHITPVISSNEAPIEAQIRMSHERIRSNHDTMTYFFKVFSIFAHVSRSVTVRLKTSCAEVVSGSTQKYPCRSN